MDSNVIEISDSVRGSSSHAYKQNVTVSHARLIKLVEVLSRYGSLSAEALTCLASVKAKRVALKKNYKLYSLCQGKAEIFVVSQGWLSLCHSSSKRGEDICNVYMPGDIVGLRESFFNNHDITLLAMQDCQLDKVTVEDVHEVFAEYPDVRKAIVSYIMVNDNIAIERLRSCTHLKAEERVAHFLLEIYARCNFNEMIDSNEFYFPVTQEVMGKLLGITNVHVSRCMTTLEQKKLIRKSRATIRLLEPSLLAEITGFDKDLIYSNVNLT